MVKKGIFLTIFLLFPFIANAIDFTAKVNRNNISIGESFNLKLELFNTSSDETPFIKPITKNFKVNSLGKSSSTSIINGKVSSSISWQYILTPKKEGEFTIPPIKIKTEKGTVFTKPIKINVSSASSLPTANKQQGLFIHAKVNNKTPYKNEPIIYNATFISKKPISDISISDMNIENAIVEKVEEPKILRGLQNGVEVNVIKLNYKVTPLNKGKLTIPSIIISGGVETENSRFSSMLDDNFDPFNMFKGFNSFGGLGLKRLKPFNLATKPINLNVKDAVNSVNPWLVASSIKLSEVFDKNQNLKVGEPINRKITIVGEGISSSQLPDLTSLWGSDKFKIYSDKPTLGETIKKNKINSWRQENYTIIPQESGELILPEITLNWWNSKQKKLETAIIKSRKLNISPAENGSVNSNIDSLQNYSKNNQSDNSLNNEKILNEKLKNDNLNIEQPKNNFNYIIISILSFVVIIMSITIIVLQRKIAQKNSVNTQKTNLNAQKNRKPNIKSSYKQLNNIANTENLKLFLQSYGEANMGLNKNPNLGLVFDIIKKNMPEAGDKCDILLSKIHSNLYNSQTIDIKENIQELAKLLADYEKNIRKNKVVKKQIVTEINPS